MLSAERCISSTKNKTVRVLSSGAAMIAPALRFRESLREPVDDAIKKQNWMRFPVDTKLEIFRP